MRLTAPIALAVFFVLPLATFAAPEAGPTGTADAVASAQRRLDDARTQLAAAVTRIEKDPPSNADLDAAQAAVDSLKAALEAGTDQESKDLDYAKAVMTARKDLRAKREYVTQRRSSIQLFNARQAVDTALATLRERTARLNAKDPSTRDFEDARAAAAAVRKPLEDARPLESQDAKFAVYLAETQSVVETQEKAIDDRWVQVSAQKQRGLLGVSRQALVDAMTALNKGWSDAQYETTDRTATVLSKRIEEGKPLEGRDSAYRADAEKARAELGQSRKRMDELVSEAGLARVKGEVEPAHKDLVTAGQAARAQNAAPEQLAEAKTATIVVGKLVDKYQAQAARSPAMKAYLDDVKKTVVEVEGVLQKRSLSTAQAAALQAVRAIEKRSPADEQFEEAKKALGALEKTLGTVNTKNPDLVAPVADARTLLREGRATLAKRRGEVELQQHRTEVDEARRNAAALVTELQRTKPTEEKLKEAEGALKALGATLEEGAAFAKKDRDYAKYARETKERIAQLSERVAQRRVFVAASDGRAALSEEVASAKSRLEASRRPEATDADVEAAAQSVETLTQGLETRASLHKQDAGYAAQAEKARTQLAQLTESLEVAKQARLLRQRTGEALAAGSQSAEAGAAEKNLRKQKDHYEKATAQFQTCASAGGDMVRKNRALGSMPVLVESKTSTVDEVIALCSKWADKAKVQLHQTLGLVGFEDGPKRSLEAARPLLAQGKQKEALNVLDECVASGRILQARHPELRDRTFAVAGSNTTLETVIQECVKLRKPITR